MEISVEHDKKTGKNQVVSTTSITSETIQERGLKVYDDGRKAIYALHQDGGKMPNGAVGMMTPTDVEELLHQATEKNVPTEVQYHQPVYSLPYTESSRPATPRQTPTPSPFQSSFSSRNGAQTLRLESQGSQDLETLKTSKSPSPSLIQQGSMSRVQRQREETKPYPHIPGESKGDIHFGAKTVGLTNRKMDVGSLNPAALVSVKARSDKIPAPKQLFYTRIDGSSHKPGDDPDALTESLGDVPRHSPFSAESIDCLNLINTLPEELESEPLTMIFMGYENAEDEDDIQAELVIISSDDDDDKVHYGRNGSDREVCLSYHPEGYKSKVFQPKVGIAKVTGCRDVIEDTYSTWNDLGLHKPTFTYNPERPSPHLQGQGMDESENTGSINLEMKLQSFISTER